MALSFSTRFYSESLVTRNSHRLLQEFAAYPEAGFQNHQPSLWLCEHCYFRQLFEGLHLTRSWWKSSHLSGHTFLTSDEWVLLPHKYLVTATLLLCGRHTGKYLRRGLFSRVRF
jgi:hypothetical protein